MDDNDHAAGGSEFARIFEQEVRERAYYLWKKEGAPGGQGGDDYWHRALKERLRERSFELWQQDGSPEGKEIEYIQKLRTLLASKTDAL
jgi:hypothetical protein